MIGFPLRVSSSLGGKSAAEVRLDYPKDLRWPARTLPARSGLQHTKLGFRGLGFKSVGLQGFGFTVKVLSVGFKI